MAVLDLLPLFLPLTEGRSFRWLAMNIPMDLGTGGGTFTSDIDVIACLRPFPGCVSRKPLFKTWGVKVAVLEGAGRIRSLKGGKTRQILVQLTKCPP
jgi:hypothetical protein